MSPTPVLGQIDTEVLRAALESGLEAALGEPVDIVDVVPGEFDGGSSFSAGRVSVALSSGQSIPVFVKDLNPINQLPEAQAVRDASLSRSRREVHVYRTILPALNIGTPTLYAILWNESEGLFWLFLEDAGPKRLSRLGDFDLWVEAAAWLGNFHRVATRLEPNPDLPEVEIEELRSRCVRTAQTISRLGSGEGKELKRGLESLDRHLGEVFAGPHSMIHGEFFGKNVVIRPSPTESMIAVVDWETAALGPSHLDLVSITAGRWTLDQRLIMRRAYFNTAVPDGDATAWREFNRQADSAALVSALSWLGWWSEGDDAHIERWLKEAQFVASNLH